MHNHLHSKILNAQQIIQHAIQSFGLSHVALSFNGGKDCTVLLHLLYNVLSNPSPPHPPLPAPSPSNLSTLPPLKAIYITSPAPFPEVEHFVDHTAEAYHLDLVRIEGGMKAALAVYLGEREDRRNEPGWGTGKGVQAVLVGTRRGDPHGCAFQRVLFPLSFDFR